MIGNYKAKVSRAYMSRLIFAWVYEFKLFWIYSISDLTGMLNIIYDQNLVKVEIILTAYGKRNLSLMGKVSAITTLIIPMFSTLSTTVLPAPETKLNTNLNRLIQTFIWKIERTIISYENWHKDIEHRGFKLLKLIGNTCRRLCK